MEIPEAARSAAKELGYSNLKPERLEVVETFVKGRDVFAVLPTGYGKSLSRACGGVHYPSSWGSQRYFTLQACDGSCTERDYPPVAEDKVNFNVKISILKIRRNSMYSC